jgi:hypothetical protein
MRVLTIGCCLALLAGCAKPDQQASKDSTAAPLGAGAAATPISLGAVAGKWTMRTMAETSDSVLLTFELVATADPSGWTFNFPNRPPVPVRVVSTDGDSIVTEAGPYESLLRKGVQVSTHSVMRLQNGDLVGTTVAHYAGAGADSILNLRSHGTRAQ